MQNRVKKPQQKAQFAAQPSPLPTYFFNRQPSATAQAESPNKCQLCLISVAQLIKVVHIKALENVSFANFLNTDIVFNHVTHKRFAVDKRYFGIAGLLLTHYH